LVCAEDLWTVDDIDVARGRGTSGRTGGLARVFTRVAGGRGPGQLQLGRYRRRRGVHGAGGAVGHVLWSTNAVSARPTNGRWWLAGELHYSKVAKSVDSHL